jgi:hypothetical protein
MLTCEAPAGKAGGDTLCISWFTPWVLFPNVLYLALHVLLSGGDGWLTPGPFSRKCLHLGLPEGYGCPLKAAPQPVTDMGMQMAYPSLQVGTTLWCHLDHKAPPWAQQRSKFCAADLSALTATLNPLPFSANSKSCLLPQNPAFGKCAHRWVIQRGNKFFCG